MFLSTFSIGEKSVTTRDELPDPSQGGSKAVEEFLHIYQCLNLTIVNRQVQSSTWNPFGVVTFIGYMRKNA